jgi:DNA polymerase
MNVLTIDWETYYSKELGFKTHTTEAYIRHEDFHEIGVSVAASDGHAKWFSGTRDQIKVWLNQFDWENSLVLAHNTKFDGAILSWRYGIKPRGWLDTLCMARALHGVDAGGSLKALAERYEVGVKGTEVENALGLRRVDFTPEHLARYGEYCCNDTELTRSIFWLMAQNFPQKELRVIDATLQMFINPTLVLDEGMLREHLLDVKAKKAALLAAAEVETADLMSNDKFADLLRLVGVEPPTKISTRTGKEAWAFAKTDEEFNALLEHPDLRVQALVGARLGTKTTLEETRTQRLMEIAQRGPLPVPLKYYGARTGRWSADDSINMQNLPRKSKIKQAVRAPEGFVLLGADLSNIELRVGLRISGQLDKLELLRNKLDLYKDFAASVFSVDYDDVDKDQRFIGKTSQLSLIFGVGAAKLRSAIRTGSGVDIGENMSGSIVGLYRTDYAKVKAMWNAGNDVLESIRANRTTPYGHEGMFQVHGERGILLPSGLYLQYPDLRKFNDVDSGKVQWEYKIRYGTDRIYGAKVFQGLTQAVARCIMAEHLLVIQKQYPTALTIHDALYMLVPKEKAESAKDFVLKTMRTAPEWLPDIPLDAEAGYGGTLADC